MIIVVYKSCFNKKISKKNCFINNIKYDHLRNYEK